jgi:hypothetical protein
MDTEVPPVNPEHRQGSREQALAYFEEQLDGIPGEHYIGLLRNIYNFVMTGARGIAMASIKMKNGKTFYLTGEIR